VRRKGRGRGLGGIGFGLHGKLRRWLGEYPLANKAGLCLVKGLAAFRPDFSVPVDAGGQ
jgi:hypothetical protein